MKTYSNKVSEAAKLIRQGMAILDGGPLDFYLTELAGANEYLINRYGPFKVGDRAMVVKRPDPFPSGWEHCSHFIKTGALVTIKGVECLSKGFRISVEFDDESWINRDGQIIPVDEDRKHLFTFGDSALVKVPA